jgi:uncharacterized protein
MTYNKIILAGGSGQMGTAIASHFKTKCKEIIILSRQPTKIQDNIRTITWDGKIIGDWYKEIEGADILINLTGKSVNCRYTEANKKEIFDSRTNSIDILAKAIKLCKQAPLLWIQSASATIYRHAEDRAMTETNGEIGEGFSIDVCKKWEQTFETKTAEFKNMRKIILRTSLVLGKIEGVFPRLKNLVKFGLGGKQGNGNQLVSWVHEKDVATMIEWISNKPEIHGVINCTSPLPISNIKFMNTFRQVYGIPFGLPTPTWLLKLGAIIIGTETELILKSRWVLPEKIEATGYKFMYPDLESALKQILNNNS